MAASGRLVGILLLGFGLILGVAIVLWLIFGVLDDKTERTGAIFGFVLLFGALVLPLVGGGIYFLVKGQAEAKDLARVKQQRLLLDIVLTRGQIAIPDLVLEMKTTRDRVQGDLYELVGRGLFSGYVDWKRGVLFSVEASQLQGRNQCPNCGGSPLELAGKGIIRCPYCGAEIFLTG